MLSMTGKILCARSAKDTALSSVFFLLPVMPKVGRQNE